MHKYNHWGYILTLPFVIGFIIFSAYPFLYSIYLTFTTWDMFNPPKWVGLKNWSNLFHEYPFWYSLRNLLYFALLFVPLQTFGALVVAYMLNQSIRAKGLFRVLYFLPVVTPWIAGGLLWKWILDSNFGLVNLFLGYVGLGPFKLLDHPNWWVVIGTIAVVNVWKGIGSSMVILLAGMQNISKEMLEAAAIDGAGRWTLFSRITVPLVSPMVFMVLILSSISAFHAFDVFLVMLEAPNIVKDQLLTTNILIYRDAFLTFKMGSASAMSWMLFLIILAFTMVQKKFEKRWVHYE
ncbi:carbohydrate ABC transporter permease [Paenibacillus nasutitermitis]|uniref:Sugar ABC transporter permease n=1 Tax=Paenibacillus nasutitermitis TaxID=1652958 RepID=A0A917E0U7_9BACL|nr:sugar ABC transporter permease [Paenibacillus nasutitermitis]GGD89344.1 sugar ABC transporter permease [Paenibacillus nasutitermitis]